MYLKKLYIINSGSIARLELNPEFTPDGLPKPVVLVGVNGGGKTGTLSVLADALVEVAAHHYKDITAAVGAERRYYRVVGGVTRRIQATYELSLAEFTSPNMIYLSKAGAVPALESVEFARYNIPQPLTTEKNVKFVWGDTAPIEREFREGAYAFLPSYRSETPHWMADKPALDERVPFRMSFTGRLGKPIEVQSSIAETAPWIMEIMLEASIDTFEFLSSPNLAEFKQTTLQRMNQKALPFISINEIFKLILGRPQARLIRTGRVGGNRKIMIIDGKEVVIPSLDSLSAGQTSLLSIFSTLLRYGDSANLMQHSSQIRGICLVDEIDAHLHASLQYDALPSLIKLFPRVQFIVTSHAPLFPLGLKKAMGGDGFTLIDMPSGLSIDAERYKEFEQSFRYYQITEAFEREVQNSVAARQRPVVLCEGETDPLYLRTAARLLGYDDVLAAADFDWPGRIAAKGAAGGGSGQLDTIFKAVKYQPSLLRAKHILLYDADTSKEESVSGDYLYVMRLPPNPANTVRRKGIENLLPASVFVPEMYVERLIEGDDPVKKTELDKKKLVETLSCSEEPSVFKNFGPVLERIKAVVCMP